MKPFRHDYITSQVLRFHQTALRYSASALSVVAILEGCAQVKRFSRLSEMSAGDVFFVNAGEVWAMTSREGCTALCVEIETALLPQVSYPYADRVQLVDSLVDPDQTREVSLVYRDCIFLKDILETYALFNQKEKASQRPLMEEKLGLTLVMEYNVQNEVNRQFRAVSEDKFVRYYRILDYIVTHLEEKLSLQQAADAEKMQKSYFAQLWKQNDNMTFLECVSRCRLREAERLLLFTAESNAGICKACGFSDSKYFYRNFQQEFEMTPSQWKSRWTQGRCPDEERLPLTEGLRCVAVQQRQLDYVKTDTRLYQQYLWLREGPETKAAALELKLDLYHPDNVLMLGQQRVLTWYGFDLLMNIVRQRQLSVTLQLRMDCLLEPQDQQEFEELIAQVYARLGTRVTKNWKFELACRSERELDQAEKLCGWLQKKLPTCKAVCVLT